MTRRLFVGSVLVPVSVVVTVGCFNPNYGSVTCGPVGECPSGMECSAADNHCYPIGQAPIDAGVDALGPLTTITSPAGGSTTEPAVDLTFSSASGAATFECRLDGGAWASCTSPQSYVALTAGSHTLSVRATDSGGNVGPEASVTWTVDPALGPTTTITGSPADGSAVATTAYSFSLGATPPGVTFECKLDAAAWGPCTSNPISGTATEGTHTFSARGTRSGVTGAVASTTWAVDTVAPTVTITVHPTDGGSAGSAQAFTFTYTDPAPSSGWSSVRCQVDGGASADCGPGSATPGSISFASLANNASHTFVVTATDRALHATSKSFVWDICTYPWTASGTGSDSDRGHCKSPFRTINKATTSAAAGNSIEVLPGTYGTASGEPTPLVVTNNQWLIGDHANKGAGASPTKITVPMTLSGASSGVDGLWFNPAQMTVTSSVTSGGIKSSTFSNSTAGQVISGSGTFTIDSSDVKPSAGTCVEGVYLFAGSVTMTNSTVTGQFIGVGLNGAGATFTSGGNNAFWCNTGVDLFVPGGTANATGVSWDHAGPTNRATPAWGGCSEASGLDIFIGSGATVTYTPWNAVHSPNCN